MNWNRARLLKQTVESYLATTKLIDVELFVVDNASTDGSREYLKELTSRLPIKAIYLDENIGGEAFNHAIPLAKHPFIHLSGNDQIFLPGWTDHVRQSFDTYEDLGQLSLFCNVPTDDEAWAVKPAQLRFKAGKLLYQAEGNVGASSIIRGELFRERGIKVKNVELGNLKFPSDGQLSLDIKAAGYWVAWADRYYVRNVGHERAEFEADPAYYEQNYANKPWIGLDGWRARVASQKEMPRSERRSTSLPDALPIPEGTVNDVNGKPSQLWSMQDTLTAEVEVLDFLHALVRLTKPDRVLETRTWLGHASCSIAAALVANGFGSLTTFESDLDAHSYALQNLRARGFDRHVECRAEAGTDSNPLGKFDLAFFNSHPSLQARELQHFLPWLNPGAIVVCHGPEVVTSSSLVGFDLPTPRGLFVGKLAKP